jgi:hypothetical protein
MALGSRTIKNVHKTALALHGTSDSRLTMHNNAAVLFSALVVLIHFNSGVQAATPVLPNSVPKKVFAHFFSPFPISIDNKAPDQDYYARNYLQPQGENGKFNKSGGYIREVCIAALCAIRFFKRVCQ